MELPFNSSFWICNLYGYSEDSTTGEVSVVMQAMRGDLRNLIDLRVRYLKSRMRNTTKKGAQMVMMIMMPFPQHMILFMVRTIAIGVQSLHSRGLITKTSRPPTFFVAPWLKTGLHHQKRQIEARFGLCVSWGGSRGLREFQRRSWHRVLEGARSVEGTPKQHHTHIFSSCGCIWFLDGVLRVTHWSHSL
jgi:hypothetical protein